MTPWSCWAVAVWGQRRLLRQSTHPLNLNCWLEEELQVLGQRSRCDHGSLDRKMTLARKKIVSSFCKYVMSAILTPLQLVLVLASSARPCNTTACNTTGMCILSIPSQFKSHRTPLSWACKHWSIRSQSNNISYIPTFCNFLAGVGCAAGTSWLSLRKDMVCFPFPFTRVRPLWLKKYRTYQSDWPEALSDCCLAQCWCLDWSCWLPGLLY